ncbi:MAG: TonB-dependent receptor [Bacteroidetes bacterium]|nr:TonB-dependent receptor [Bacteroidota bacterium]
MILPATISAQQIELRGKVLDFDTKQPIPGASIYVKTINKGTIATDSGKFSLSLPIDSYDLLCSSFGYKSASKMVYLLDESFVLIELKKKPPTELPEVIIESRKKDANVTELKMSTININVAQLRKTALTIGEADLIKALTLQSGITTAGEGANGFNVRGGNVDQNLVLLDGAPIFNTAHLLGFYSVISADAVQNFTLYKGAIPASYGGRLSSLVAISIKPGNEQKVRYNTGVGPISAHVFADGPINKKLTFFAGARVAYPRMIISLFPGSAGNSNAFFYDGTGKVNYKINEKNRLSLSLYRSLDNFRFQGDTSYSWQTNIVSFNLRSELAKKLVFYLNSNYSYYISDINGFQPTYQFRLRSNIQQQEAKAGLSYQLTANNYMEIGGDFISYKVSPGNLRPMAKTSVINHISIENEQGNEISAYFLDKLDINDFISFEAGIRQSNFLYKGPHTIYTYENGQPWSQSTLTDSIFYPKGKKIQSYSGWEPRILMKIKLNGKTSVKMNYNKTFQYLQIVSNTISVTPIDYWKLCDKQIKPAMTSQFALGVFRNFDNDIFETSVEGYYKKSINLLDYKNGADLSLNPYIDADLFNANGKAYGIELTIKKTKGKYTGQVAYTWSRSYLQDVTPFPSEKVNNGLYYPSNFDRPVNLNISGTIKLGKGWEFNCNFIYLSGRPATYPDGTYFINGSVVTNYSLRNEDRLPDYNRLDISFSHDSRRFAEQKKYTILNFSIYNVYARKNPYSVYFQQNTYGLNSYKLSVLGTIIPSITLYFFF